MNGLSALIQHYGLFVVFVAVLASRMGIPMPAFPTLVTAGALTSGGAHDVVGLVLAGIAGGLIADLTWFVASRRYGRTLLSLLCRVSISPDSCVRQTESLYAKIGNLSLIFGNGMPGVGLMSIALAAIAGMPFVKFLVLDTVGEALFVGAAVILGVLFNSAIIAFVATLAHLGAMGLAFVLGVLAIYIFGRWCRRQLFVRQLRMDRITAIELGEMIDRGETPVVIDVRPLDLRRDEGVIPGAVFAHPADPKQSLAGFSQDQEVVVYCACPNEASAVAAVRHLRRAGFRKIRPLLGGLEAWIATGRQVVNPDVSCEPPGQQALREDRTSVRDVQPVD